MKLRDDRSDAVFSDDRTYRYRLMRTWDAEKPTLAWIMLNPSTADETEDDPTIRRCLGYAEDWGYGTIVVGNLFAYRTKNPEELVNKEDPFGPDNWQHLWDICRDADRVVVGWGAHDIASTTGLPSVAWVMRATGNDLYCLGTTQDGNPKHPLYLPKDAHLKPFALDAEPRTDGGHLPSDLADDSFRTYRDEGVTVDDLNDCWCCGGLTDAPSLCGPCSDAGCNRFTDECKSGHEPVDPCSGGGES